uniref:Homing endonuclease LAGLIDADG domain-containing protein n=1 Tax=Dactylella tenuis TaxID=383872 RepID=A0A4Y5MXG1_9PEZI|nr:hypothetical protein [Dactylella tenuis]QCW06802.1 hypothetical protein [Dactylella tenuis]
MISISKNSQFRSNWSVKLVFNIHLHSKDINILYLIQRFFGVGNITLHDDAAHFSVIKLTDLACIINHFDNYPLKTQKHADFLLFKLAFDLVNNKEHLTHEGLRKLVSIRAPLNKGLPERLKIAFPDITPMLRPEVTEPNLIANSSEVKHWIAGFVSGEGSFIIKQSKSKTHKLGVSTSLNFLVVQNIRDVNLLKSFVQFLGCGQYSINEKSGIITYSVSKFSDIANIIIPLFEEYPILGVKAKDFEDFKEVSALIKSKDHLTHEGLNKIILYKSRMNSNRLE